MEDEHAMDRSAGDAYGEGKWSCARARTYPEVAGELGAEAVEEGLPVEPRVPRISISARSSVPHPAPSQRRRELDQRLNKNDERSANARDPFTLHGLPEALGVCRRLRGARDDGGVGDWRHLSVLFAVAE